MSGIGRRLEPGSLVAVGLLVLFAAGGFIGLAAWNHHLLAGGRAFLSLETPVDRWIPLRPGWVWVYLSYYPLCCLPLLLLDRREVLARLVRAYALQFGIAFVCFLLFPVRMIQPAVIGDSASADLLRWVYSVDPGFNVFPSLHVANAWMVVAAFVRFRGRVWAVPVGVWAGLVMLSTVLVKQHYAIDLVAGVALGMAADRFALRSPVRVAPPVPGPMDATG